MTTQYKVRSFLSRKLCKTFPRISLFLNPAGMRGKFDWNILKKQRYEKRYLTYKLARKTVVIDWPIEK